MTIIEAIGLVDDVKPNKYGQETKIRWLSELDGRIHSEILDTHEGAEETAFDGYGEEDINKTLLVPAPYDDLYIKWLETQIDYATGEYGKYNNSAAAFNSAYAAFSGQYHRTHLPKGAKIRFF